MTTHDYRCVCTLKELAERIARAISKRYVDDVAFEFVDFSIVNRGKWKAPTENDVEKIYTEARTWYGVRKIDTHFGNTAVATIGCDKYYGGRGGARISGFAVNEQSADVFSKKLLAMMKGTLSADFENVPDDLLIVAETSTRYPVF